MIILIIYLIGYITALVLLIFNETEFDDETVLGFITALFMALGSWMVVLIELPEALRGVNLHTIVFRKRKE